MNQLLLIEDNQADARLVQEYLSEANGNGLAVHWENRLEAGLDWLQTGRSDCVLLDLGLPDSPGVDSVGRVVRAAGGIPVVVLTGLRDEETAVRAVQSGADDYVRKDEMTAASLWRTVHYAAERRRLQAAVREEAARLEEAFEASPAAIATLRGPQHVFEMVNPAYRKLVGDREVVGRPVREVFPELDGAGYFEALDHVYETGEKAIGHEQLLELDSPDAELSDPKYVNLVYQPRRESGEIVGVLAHVIDVTREVEARRAVERHQERLENILNTVSEGVLVVDPGLEFRFANPAAARILGVDREQIHRQDYDDLDWGVEIPSGGVLPEGRRPVEHVLETGRPVENTEIAVVRPDGQELVLSVNAAPLTSGSGGDEGVVVSIRDVTERSRYEKELQHRALHDTLTGLPNRALFHDRLEHVLESVGRTKESLAVLFLDIDRFKVINDTLGHEAGDRLLEQIAERLQASVRDSDTVARMGGDEFTVLLEGIDDEEIVEKRAQAILEAVSEPVVLGEGQQVHVEVSVGVALPSHVSAGEGLSVADALIARADEAMFQAKEVAGSAYRFASPTEEPGVPPRLMVEARLRSALREGTMETHYQPIFHLGTGRIAGLEALARWEDPELGAVSPGEFIPLAEETGLIVELGRQQLATACRQLEEWSGGQPVGRDLRLHVNLSMGQLDDPELIGHLRGILDTTELPVEQLWLEITESVTMRQPERLTELSAMGARLTVDDFGTRYSTLTQLKRLKLDGLKIDRSFVGGLVDDPQDLAIVESVVNLGHRLGFEVVAEGIETEEQLELLKEIGCDYGQGFLLGRPMPAADVTDLLTGGS